jgi:hypothetical protein
MAGPGSVADGTNQAQEELRPWDEAALEAIRFGWGDAYEIGHDDERGYWARRLDRIGVLILADSPDKVHEQVAADYAAKRVERKAADR